MQIDLIPERAYDGGGAAARGLAEAVCAAAGRGCFREALSLYAASTTFAATAALKACARLPHLRGGAAIHAQARKLGFAPSDVYVHTALVDLYAKTGGATHARKLFDEMPAPNTVTWNSLLSAHVNSGCLAAACEVFFAMPARDAVSHGRRRALFQRMPEKNAESWNALISGLAACGDMRRRGNCSTKCAEEPSLVDRHDRRLHKAGGRDCRRAPVRRNAAQEHARVERDGGVLRAERAPAGGAAAVLRMQKTHVGGGAEAQPDGKTFSSLLSACAQLGELRFGRWALTHIAAAGIPLDDHLRTALVDLHAKCGDIDGAFRLFRGLTLRDVVSYSAMIAISLYGEMGEEGISPNAVTFVGLLAAYSHAGMVEEGCRCFAGMAAEHGISPTVDHYAIIVDLLGRAGRLEEAYNVACRMPVAPHAGVWGLCCSPAGCTVAWSSARLPPAAAPSSSRIQPPTSSSWLISTPPPADGTRPGPCGLPWKRGGSPRYVGAVGRSPVEKASHTAPPEPLLPPPVVAPPWIRGGGGGGCLL
ncbi:unnamed protein product [Spirodela intermedia]|uniref:Uncharacterized protein n=1 Tax=Spirodela intermedia TaxID=51605 RepID=A0A7I8J2W9_SPIIN|nr:unnamed protein product [Spirodela intermedia]CAA6663680.1 unnamed protein product [Spirodela intermedia]